MKRERFLMAILLSLGLMSPASAREPESKFLWVSDIHFNPMADAALVPDLQKTDPAQWEPILNRTSPNNFSQYKSDTNWWLLKSSLEQFPRTLRHPAFVMVTGDLLAHNFPRIYRGITPDADQQQYAAFVLKTVRFLALRLQREFPGAKIYITPGNNDNDCGNYSVQANGEFLHDTAEIARALATGDAEFTKGWQSLGSFNVPHPTVPGMRIISLNSIFWSQKYLALSSEQGCKAVSTTAPADLLKWLDGELAAAALAKQKVWLMFHIPPGIDGYSSASARQSAIKGGAPDNAETCAKAIVPMWVPEWTAQFDDLLTKYRATAIATFAAHIHSDDFRLVGATSEGRTFILLGPAISPVYEENPSFRVVSYRRDGTLTDHTTYYLANLPAASSKHKGKWKQEYTYTREWKTATLDADSLARLYDEVVGNEKARSRWLSLYAVRGPAQNEQKTMERALYCADEALSVESYTECWCSAKP